MGGLRPVTDTQRLRARRWDAIVLGSGIAGLVYFDRRPVAPGELEAHLESLSDAESKVHKPTAEELAEAAESLEPADPGATPA